LKSNLFYIFKQILGIFGRFLKVKKKYYFNIFLNKNSLKNNLFYIFKQILGIFKCFLKMIFN